MEQTFEEYLKQARWDFAKVAEKYPVEKNLELRTAIDSLLIAYDQAVHQALSLADVVGRSEQLPDEKLCRMNQNFVCNCIDDSRCPNF